MYEAAKALQLFGLNPQSCWETSWRYDEVFADMSQEMSRVKKSEEKAEQSSEVWSEYITQPELCQIRMLPIPERTRNTIVGSNSREPQKVPSWRARSRVLLVPSVPLSLPPRVNH